jgi:hypothetical protein
MNLCQTRPHDICTGRLTSQDIIHRDIPKRNVRYISVSMSLEIGLVRLSGVSRLCLSASSLLNYYKGVGDLTKEMKEEEKAKFGP